MNFQQKMITITTLTLSLICLGACKPSANSLSTPKLMESENLRCSPGDKSCTTKAPEWLVNLSITMEQKGEPFPPLPLPPLPSDQNENPPASEPKARSGFNNRSCRAISTSQSTSLPPLCTCKSDENLHCLPTYAGPEVTEGACLCQDIRDIYCGGAYVAPGTILTAAHCVEDVTKEGIQATNITAYFHLGGKRYEVNIKLSDRVLLKENSDLALLRFEESKLPPHTELPTPIPLAHSFESDQKATVYGTGKVTLNKEQDTFTREGQGLHQVDRIIIEPEHIQTLQEACLPPFPPLLPPLQNKEGETAFTATDETDKKKEALCSGDAAPNPEDMNRTMVLMAPEKSTGPQGACSGDSGSPITQQTSQGEALVGIVSSGHSWDGFANNFGKKNAIHCGEIIFSPKIPYYANISPQFFSTIKRLTKN